MNIDLVYTWVDGNDPEWIKKKENFIDKKINTVGRFQDNNELKYSLRSIEKHIPWIRKIFIITDNQTPSFLDTKNPRIEIINHSEIIPKKYLPVFNSNTIEYFMYKIPELSEFFLYSNDDMFINEDLKPSFFFRNGLPIIRRKSNSLIKIKIQFKRAFNIRLNNYRLAIENAYTIFKKKFNVFYPISPHHNIDAYLKSDIKTLVEDIFPEELNKSFLNRFRHKSDIQRILISYYSIFKKRGIMSIVNRKESCRMPVYKANYQRYIDKYNPKLFCLNDCEKATDNERKLVEPFLKKLYPEKSSFEK